MRTLAGNYKLLSPFVSPCDKCMISTVIPTYNRWPMVARAVESALCQQFEDTEVIVVDDGSTDATAERLDEQFGQRVRVLQQRNRGVSAARNAGINAARGDRIALLDSDDEWLPHKLQQQMAAMAANPGVRFCHSDEIWIRNGVRVNPMKKHAKRGGQVFEHCLPLCAITPSSVLLDRDVFDEIGSFDESLPACEDYDFWLRYTARHRVLYVDQQLLTRYAGHPGQLSAQHWGMDRFRVRALAKLLCSDALDAQQRRAANAMFERKCAILAKGARKHDNPSLLDELARLAASLDEHHRS